MLKAYIQENLPKIDQTLHTLIPGENAYPPEIFDAMRYSLFAGGKRLRPLMVLAAADAVGGRGIDFIEIASSLEMIHTYSLIHDDLPAMDNDDYRRGKPTNHKVYGEGMAILAGDGLLNAAFETILNQQHIQPDIIVKVAREIAGAAGVYGMIGGQVIDLESEGQTIDLKTLEKMHQAKTGALFKAALRAGGILGGATGQQLSALTKYAENFGLAFQITDDILDVIGNEQQLGKPVGSDEKNHKATYVSLYSLNEAQKMAKTTVEQALDSLREFGPEADILRELVKYLLNRNS